MSTARGLLLVGAAPAVVATRATIRDRRARLWLVIVDAWVRTVLGGGDCLPALGPALRRLARTFDASLERSRFDGTAVDVQRARAWRDALRTDEGPLSNAGAATVLWAAVATWDDAAAEQRARRERGGVPWERYARAAEAVVEAIDDAGATDAARAADALRGRMEDVEARLWGRAVEASSEATDRRDGR